MRAVITGSSSIVALRTAEILQARGARVAGVDLNPVDHPAYVSSIEADLSRPEGAECAIDEARRRLGGIDVLVTAAAHQATASLDTTSDATWRAVLAGTLDSAFFTIRAVVPHLYPGSSIVAITSVNAYLAHPGNAAYAVAKGGIHALITQASLEYAPRGVRVNAVAPAIMDGAKVPDGATGHPMGRTVTSGEVAEAVAFLASPAASGITGVVLPVDAGLSVASPTSFTRPALHQRWRASVDRGPHSSTP